MFRKRLRVTYCPEPLYTAKEVRGILEAHSQIEYWRKCIERETSASERKTSQRLLRYLLEEDKGSMKNLRELNFFTEKYWKKLEELTKEDSITL